MAGEEGDALYSLPPWSTKAHTIAAPGNCILTTSRTGGYGYDASPGTSAAAPHVTGVVALCLWDLNTSGICSGKSVANIVSTIRADAQTYSTNNADYRYTGDQFTPVGARYYGYLVEADTY